MYKLENILESAILLLEEGHVAPLNMPGFIFDIFLINRGADGCCFEEYGDM
jgi:hypothetical protein